MMYNLTTITIPNSVLSIGEQAFYLCYSLNEVYLGGNIETIGKYAFCGCPLTSITLPSSVSSIGEYAFNSSSSLTSIVVESNNSFYDSRNNCNALIESATNRLIVGCQNTIIPKSVTSIGDYAFRYCSSLTSIAIPNSVTSIGDYAFGNCSSLAAITIPENLTTLGDYVFSDCSTLNSVVWNAKNCSIAPFNDISSQITSFTFGENVEYIPAALCDRMTSLISIIIPNSVSEIGAFAFAECSSLTSVTCDAHIPPTLRYEVFWGISSSVPIYVPCGTIEAYFMSDWFAYNIQEPSARYEIFVSSQNEEMGDVYIDQHSICGTQIVAYENHGYHFVQWSDGNSDNPRSLVLTQDTTLTAEFATNQYTIKTVSLNSERGKTQGDTTVNYLESVTISATPNYGYHFTQWHDGNTDNPRVVKVTEDKTYTAQFDKNIYNITLHCNEEQGNASGVSSAEYLDEVTISATANLGYHFVKWSDGNSDTHRKLIITQDTTLTAEFAQTYSGQCGDDLYWNYDEDTKTLSITGSGEMYDYTQSTQPWLLFQDQITEVTTSNTTSSIGTSAFAGCVRLSKVSLGYGMVKVAANAFAECNRLYDIYSYATYPPFAEESSFANYNVYLYIPCESKRDYQLDIVWGKFKFVECMGAESEEMEGEGVVIAPGSTDVTITWPTEGDAETYTIVIKKGDAVFCTLTFNKEGQLMNIAFAPGRNGNHAAQYAERAANGGYRFTVTSLEEDTKYGYNLDVKNGANKTIKSYSGEFTTGETTSLEDIITNDNAAQKLLRNGQLIIIRDGKEYNVLGTKM